MNKVYLNRDEFYLIIESSNIIYKEDLCIDQFSYCKTEIDVLDLIDDCLESEKYILEPTQIIFKTVISFGKRVRIINTHIALKNKVSIDVWYKCVIQDLEKRLKDKDEILNNRNIKLEKKDKEIQELREKLEEKEIEITKLKTKIPNGKYF